MNILVANLGSTSFKFRLFRFDDAGGAAMLAKGGYERVTDYGKAIELAPAEPMLRAQQVALLQESGRAQDALTSEIERRAAALAGTVAGWRHDIHQHPELSNQETRTAALVAAHLRKLGLEVRTGVGGNGVVGILRGGKPGPVVGLRAEMDALPVVEQVDLPYRSEERRVGKECRSRWSPYH